MSKKSMSEKSSKLSIGVGMIVSGEAAFLQHSIRAIRPYVDVIAVAEGADHRWIELGNANPDGSSKDTTTEVLHRLAALPGALIKIFDPAVYGNRNQQRQVYLDYFLEQGVDICLVLDADEFYFPEHLQRLISFFENRPDAIGVKYDFWNFYTWVRRYHRTIEMERCFRLSPGLHYFDKDGGQSVVDSRGVGIWHSFLRDNDVKCFHYNRVLSGQDLINKIRFYMERDGNATRETKLKAGNIGADSITAISKNPNKGAFVPLASQPPGARSLIYSSVSQHTSWVSALDIAGVFAPCSLDHMAQAASEFSDISFFDESDLPEFNLSAGQKLQTDQMSKGLSFAENLMEFETQIFDPILCTGARTNQRRCVFGEASFDRMGWERLNDSSFATGRSKSNSIDALVVEHYLDKLGAQELDDWIRECRRLLKVGGYLRIAIPDNNAPDVSKGAVAPIDNLFELSKYLHSNGFKSVPLEYHDDKGELISRAWNQEDGFIFRSSQAGGGTKSMIVDAFKLF